MKKLSNKNLRPKGAARTSSATTKSPDRKWQRNPNAIFRQNDDGAISVILVDNADAYYRIDAWAMETWNLLNGENSVEDLIQKIQKKSKLDRPFVEKEIRRLLKDFEKFGLIIT